MSAAEKLRELDGAITDLSPFADGRFVSEIHVKEPAAQSLVALRNALPQIVALVKAAEELPEFFYTKDGQVHSFVPLLDALHEELS